MSDQKDLYYVAVKLLLLDGQKLLITKDIFGDWEDNLQLKRGGLR